MAEHQVVTVPKAAIEVLASYVDGARSRLAGLFSSNRSQPTAVRIFYEAWRGREGDQAILDLNSPAYGLLLSSRLDELKDVSESGFRVIDLGCGALTFYRWLRQNRFQIEHYEGYDLIVQATDLKFAADHGLVLREMDLSANPVIEPIQATHVSCINVLSYVPEIDNLLSAAYSASALGAKLIVIEPLPSWFWETFFQGVRVFLRSPEKIRCSAGRAGWRFVGGTTLRFRTLGGVLNVGVSAMSVFERDIK